MADVSSLNVNSTVYTIKDGVARASVENKLDKNQGTEHAGKILKIDENGYIVPSGTIVSFSDIEGLPTENTNLAAALSAKVDKSGEMEYSLGRDDTGMYAEY